MLGLVLPKAADSLVLMFENYMPQILESQGIPYTSDDMKKSINTAELETS